MYLVAFQACSPMEISCLVRPLRLQLSKCMERHKYMLMMLITMVIKMLIMIAMIMSLA